MRGFIMARKGVSNVRVGPWICDPKYGELAENLLNALTSEVEGSKIWVGVPEHNRLISGYFRIKNVHSDDFKP